jgi:NTE family protein
MDSDAESSAQPHARTRRAELALCLSGGGYRAALFHLGSLWRLHELGLLGRVERISSVSGGSILAAFLAERIRRDGAGSDQAAFARWCGSLSFRDALYAPFAQIASTDIRTWPILKNFVPNLFWHRFGARDLERAYRRLLTSRTLAELPVAPNFVLCATDLTFGVNFEFSRERVGGYQSGYLRRGDGGREPFDYPIALAVAASSCFPPIFGPLHLDLSGLRFVHAGYRGFDRDRLTRRVELTDGGVYDNLATEPVIKHARVVLVSDGGAPFDFRPGRYLLSRLLRYAAVMGHQAVALRKRLFFELQASGRLEGVLWSVSRPVRDAAFGYSDELVEGTLATIRTDLDHFTAAEIEVLVNHGYAQCAAALERQPHLLHGTPDVPPAWPFPAWADEGKVEVALRDSHRRFSLRRLLRLAQV